MLMKIVKHMYTVCVRASLEKRRSDEASLKQRLVQNRYKILLNLNSILFSGLWMRTCTQRQ